MKQEMNASLERRFSDAEENENLLIATILDPRFKEKFFTGPTIVEKVISLVRDKICDLTRQHKEDNCEHEEDNRDHEVGPSSKRPCIGIWKHFSDILEEAGASVSNESRLQELDTYLAEPLIKFGRESCYTWWATNKNRFPLLSKIARQYICAPPTTVASERLFSGAGDVYDDKRNRLAPDNAEMLLFIKNNLMT